MKKPPNQKGSVYPRPDTRMLWMRWYDASGQEHLDTTGTTDEAKANRVLAAIQRKVRAELETGLASTGPITLRRYAEKWIADRKARGVASAQDDEARLRHALPVLGSMLLTEVRPRHLRDFVRDIQAKRLVRIRDGHEEEYTLAPRTVLHVYGALRVLFRDAFVEELIPASPAVLEERRRELPTKVDKNPEWRDGAVYTREEVEALISDERIPLRQRVLYGLLFLCGVRVNEATPRRWRDYDATVEPLGKLLFATAWSRKHRKVKSVKTNVARPVPVHPTLARLLAQWRLSGWEEVYGRAPTAEDLIVPARPHPAPHRAYRPGKRNRPADVAAVTYMQTTTELEKLHEVLAMLGLRKRGQHDARSTFISLGIADGGIPEVLESITHTKQKDVQSGYQRFPWPLRCAELLKLRVSLREGRVLRLPVAAGTYGGAPEASATVLLHHPASTENEAIDSMHRTGLEAAHSRTPRVASASSGSNCLRLSPVAPPEESPDTEGCSKRSSSDAGEAATQSPRHNSQE